MNGQLQPFLERFCCYGNCRFEEFGRAFARVAQQTWCIAFRSALKQELEARGMLRHGIVGVALNPTVIEPFLTPRA